MRRTDVGFGAAITLIGIGAFVMALAMPFLSEGAPGPGFFPRIVSLGLIVLGVIQIVFGLRPQKAQVRAIGPVDELERETHGKPGPAEPGKPFLAPRSLIVLASYIVAMPIFHVFGFVLAGMALVAFLLLFVERRRGMTAYLAIPVIPIATWLLFVKLLGIELPSGILHLGLLGI